MKITIFGLAGTGTSTVGKMLAEKLGFKFFSAGDIFRKKAADWGLTLPEMHNLAVGDPSIDHECDDEVRDFGINNNDFVVESRLAWHFIPDSKKVKLTADVDIRAERIAKREQMLIKAAKDQMLEREAMDNARYAKFYGIQDMNDDKNFDLIIDTGSIPPEEVVRQIAEFINK